MHVVDRCNEGLSPEGIAVESPPLRLAHIHKTLAFYLENREDVDAYVARGQEEIERLVAALQRAPSLVELRQRLEARRRAETA